MPWALNCQAMWSDCSERTNDKSATISYWLQLIWEKLLLHVNSMRHNPAEYIIEILLYLAVDRLARTNK